MTKVPGVTDVLFVDRAGAYKAFRQDFADNKELLKATSAKDVPESFRVRVEKGIERDQVEAAVVGQPGVGFSADEAELLPLDERWLNVDIEVHLCLEDSAMPACESGRGAANKAMTTVKEKKAIVAAIKGMPEVTSHTFMDQAAAYRQFATDFEPMRHSSRPSSPATSQSRTG